MLSLKPEDSGLFGEIIDRELKYLAKNCNAPKEKLHMERRLRAKPQLETAMAKWAAFQDHATVLGGGTVILTPAKPCDISLTDKELSAVLELVRNEEEKSGFPAGYAGLKDKLEEDLERGDWMVLVRRSSVNPVYQLTFLNGTVGECLQAVYSIREQDAERYRKQKDWDPHRVAYQDEGFTGRSITAAAQFGDKECLYQAIPVALHAEQVFIVYDSLKKEYTFRFEENCRGNTPRLVMEQMWADICKSYMRNDRPGIEIHEQEQGCMYASAGIAGIGVIDILTCPVKHGEYEFTVENQWMDTARRAYESLDHIRAAFKDSADPADIAACIETLKNTLDTVFYPERKKWLILSRVNSGNFTYRFSLVSGTEEKAEAHLLHLREKDLCAPGAKPEDYQDEPARGDGNISLYGDLEDAYIDYYAVPVPTGAEWAAVRYSAINGYEFWFTKGGTREAAELIQNIWITEYLEARGDMAPELPLQNGEHGCIYAEETETDGRSLDMLAVPLSILEHGVELTVDLNDHTIRRTGNGIK